ncbi:hypothetical protein QE152_g24827 [Popillia japonica]|uniref:Craniofacial development protein 2-like n=1 Tax=Popillia japonica TaxID=7064 RepID=A0AAW1K5P6_POPJA
MQLRVRAKEETNKGKSVKIGYNKLTVDGRELRWNNKKRKIDDPSEAKKQRNRQKIPKKDDIILLGEMAEEHEKDEFYELLTNICEEIPKKDDIILLGDANAQVGREYYLRSLVGNGKGTIHAETNDNGHRLSQIAELLNLTFLSTKFEHPTRHKVTWRHPGGNTENQIDHILATKGIEKTLAQIAWMNKKDEQSRNVYTTIRNKANGIYKRKKNEWLNRQLEEINREGNRNNLRQFYKKLKCQNVKSEIKTRGMTTKDGKIEDDS